MHELILGGQRSGKSRCAEQRAELWLSQPGHVAVVLATALAGDEEMRVRIERHRLDRSRRLPRVSDEEVPVELGHALRRLCAPHRLVVIDCLTLWLTNLLMPLQGESLDDGAWHAVQEDLLGALEAANGPVLMVSNEIGMGVSPMSSEARRFVDHLGRLHQAMAQRCSSVTLMVAGLELSVRRPAP